MKVLLDTHTFLWFVEGRSELSSNVRRIIEDADSINFLSIASVWEMAIKSSLGKLTLRQPFATYISHQLTLNGFALLPITVDYASLVATLPFHHRDPFDRLLVAQALSEEMVLLSRDTLLDSYGVKRVW